MDHDRFPSQSIIDPFPAAPRSVPDVLVWEADGTVDGRVGYGAAVAGRLRRHGWSTAVVPLNRRRPTAAELEAPRHVISGGETPATSDVEWLIDTRRFLGPVLERALAGGVELTGICFGSQLLAALLAGPEAVEQHPAGMQAGLIDAADTESDEIHAVSAFHYHRIDADRLVAAGAVITMATARTPVHAFRAGAGVRVVQFHPELDPEALEVVVRRHRSVIRRFGGSFQRSVDSIDARRHRWDDQLWTRYVSGSTTLASGSTGPGDLATTSEQV